MRKGLLFLAPFALVAGLHMACSSPEQRSGFGAENLDAGGFPSSLPTADAKTDQQGCSESKTEIARVPVVIEFVVDESTSMNSDNKWTASRDAMLAAFKDMQATADPATFVGVMLYPSTMDVDPASLVDPKHYDDLVELVDVPKGTGSNTPTTAALKKAYGIVEKFKPPASGGIVPDQINRVVVLVSDGAPTDGPENAEALVEEKFAETPPIVTFSVGIGTLPNNFLTFMGRVALKGGTAPPDCDPASSDESSVCHFQITPGADADVTKQALLDAINKIRALSASCEFSFTTNQSTDLGSVEVTITDKDGKETSVPKDEENGWSFDDPDNPTKVILRGDACSASNGTVSGRVDVVIGCRTAN